MGATLNQRIINWVRGQVGKSVDAGQCWDLANRALRNAGALSSADLGPMDDTSDYVWGDPVDAKDAIAGDILQMRDYVMTTDTTTEVTFGDDSGWTSTQQETQSRGEPRHTAVVSVNSGNGALTVLEQNWGGNTDPVKSTNLRWKDAAARTTVTHKLMKRQDTGKMETAKVTVTVEVSVSGTVQAYRPRPKPKP